MARKAPEPPRDLIRHRCTSLLIGSLIAALFGHIAFLSQLSVSREAALFQQAAFRCPPVAFNTSGTHALVEQLMQREDQGLLVLQRLGPDSSVGSVCPLSGTHRCVCYGNMRYVPGATTVRLIPTPSHGQLGFFSSTGQLLVWCASMVASFVLLFSHGWRYWRLWSGEVKELLSRWLWLLAAAARRPGELWRVRCDDVKEAFAAARVRELASELQLAQSSMLIRLIGLLLIISISGDMISTVRSLLFSSFPLVQQLPSSAGGYLQGFGLMCSLYGIVLSPAAFGWIPVTHSYLTQVNVASSCFLMWKYIYMSRCFGVETSLHDYLPSYPRVSLQGGSAGFSWQAPLIALRFVQVILCGHPVLSTALQALVSLVDVAAEWEARDPGDGRSDFLRNVYLHYQAPTVLCMALVSYCYDSRLKAEAQALMASSRSDEALALAQRVLRASSDALAQLDEDLVIVDAARELASMLLYRGESIEGRSFIELLAADDQERVRRHALQQAAFSRSKPQRDDPADALHVRMKDAMGCDYIVELFWCCSRGGDGRVSHVVGVVDRSGCIVEGRDTASYDGNSETPGTSSAGAGRLGPIGEAAQVTFPAWAGSSVDSGSESGRTSVAGSEHSGLSARSAPGFCTVSVEVDSPGLDVLRGAPELGALCSQTATPGRLAELMDAASLEQLRAWLTAATDTSPVHTSLSSPAGRRFEGECQKLAQPFGTGDPASAEAPGRHVVQVAFSGRTSPSRRKGGRPKSRTSSSEATAFLAVDIFNDMHVTCVSTDSQLLREVIPTGISLLNLVDPSVIGGSVKAVVYEPLDSWLGPNIGPWHLRSNGWGAICERVRILGVELGPAPSLPQGQTLVLKIRLSGIKVSRTTRSTTIERL